jgi:7-cyano-7-deazaguanine synthase in queuosine biosynthesis
MLDPERQVGRLKLQLDGVRPGTRLLHNLSGGLDSVYQAWRLLDAGYPLVLHHCEYRTRQMRWPKENEACEKLLAWLINHDLRDFEYVTSTVDRGTAFRYPKHNDIAVLMPVTGWVMRNPKFADIQHVVTGHHRNSPDPNRPESRQVRQIAHQLAGRSWKWLKPIGGFTKDQVIRDMPDALIGLSWWCRRPDGEEPCHRCPTCRRVDGVLGFRCVEPGCGFSAKTPAGLGAHRRVHS